MLWDETEILCKPHCLRVYQQLEKHLLIIVQHFMMIERPFHTILFLAPHNWNLNNSINNTPILLFNNKQELLWAFNALVSADYQQRPWSCRCFGLATRFKTVILGVKDTARPLTWGSFSID